MLRKLLLIAALFLSLNCKNIFTKVEMEGKNMTNLNTTIENATTYFYTTLGSTKIAGVVYFKITDENYTLNYDNLKACYSIDHYSELDCLGNWNILELEDKKTDNTVKEYYYKHYYGPYISQRYIIVKYSGKNDTGILKVKCSMTDLLDKVKEILEDALSVLAIIGIIFGACVGLGCLLAIIIQVVECFKNKNKEEEEKTESSPGIEIPDANTEQEPLNTQNDSPEPEGEAKEES